MNTSSTPTTTPARRATNKLPVKYLRITVHPTNTDPTQALSLLEAELRKRYAEDISDGALVITLVR